MIITAAIFTVGCAVVPKDYKLYKGDKGSGVVTMYYEYNQFERVAEDPKQAKEEAVRRCSNWGYTGAEIFGERSKKKVVSGFVNRYRITQEYQCIK